VNIYSHESVHRRRANASRAVGGYIHNRPRRCSRDRLLSIHEDTDGRTVSDIATRWCDEEKNGPFWIKSASSCRRYPSLWTTPVPIRDAPSCTQSPSVLPCKNTLLFRNTRNLFIISATPNTINYTRSSIHSGSAESSSAEVTHSNSPSLECFDHSKMILDRWFDHLLAGMKKKRNYS